MAGSIRISRAEGSLDRHAKERGTSFERYLSFDGTRDPPTPKPWETDGQLVPTSANLEKAKRSSLETRVFVLSAGLDDVEKRLRQQLRRQTGDSRM